MAGEHFDAGARLVLCCAVGLRRTVVRNDIGRPASCTGARSAVRRK